MFQCTKCRVTKRYIISKFINNFLLTHLSSVLVSIFPEAQRTYFANTNLKVKQKLLSATYAKGLCYIHADLMFPVRLQHTTVFGCTSISSDEGEGCEIYIRFEIHEVAYPIRHVRYTALIE